jgi:ubiquinone biosynthesis protein UbiJ
VRSDGDPGLAATFAELAQTFPWFVERALGNVLGPVFGQMAADTGRMLLSIPGEFARRAGSGIGQFAGETDLLATRRDVEAFASGTADAEARVDALASRVAAIAATVEKRRRPKVT